VEFYWNFIFVWRFLDCLANCDNSTTDHLLTGWGEWKRSPADSVWQVDRRPGEVVRFPAGPWRSQPGKQSARCLPQSREARRCSTSQLARGVRGLEKWAAFHWLHRLSERPRKEVQFPLACLVLDLLPSVKRGREY